MAALVSRHQLVYSRKARGDNAAAEENARSRTRTEVGYGSAALYVARGDSEICSVCWWAIRALDFSPRSHAAFSRTQFVLGAMLMSGEWTWRDDDTVKEAYSKATNRWGVGGGGGLGLVTTVMRA